MAGPPGRPRGFGYSGLANFALVVAQSVAFFGCFGSVGAGIYLAVKIHPIVGVFSGIAGFFGSLAWLVVLLRVQHLEGPARSEPPADLRGPREPDLAPEEDPAGTQPIECRECGQTIPADESKCPACGWSYRPSDT